MQEDVTNEQPVSDAPAEDTAPVADEAEQAPEQATADNAEVVEEATEVDREAPKQEQDQIEPAKTDSRTWDSYLPQGTQSEPPKVGEDGYIDPIAYKEAIKQEMREEARFERQETKAWSELEKKYPELVEDNELREIILAKRINDVQRGGKGGLIESGEAVMRKFGQARNSGKADAQVSVKKQKAAGTSKATAPRQESDSDVAQRIRSGDPEAIASVISGWMDDGKL